jgi:signal transduction histidine kinase
MKHGIKDRFSLSLFFSLAVFVILIVTGLIIGLMSFILLKTGLVQSDQHVSMFVPVIILVLACIIVGTIVSLFMGRIPLRPIRKVILAINKLAAGDFSVKLSISRPPELKELADSFNRMAKELGSLEMLRTDFVNNFSHEFKTPIVSIKGFAEMLKYDDLTDEEKSEYLNIIINESGRLASLATNVLNLSKVENQAILSETHPYNLSEQLRRCIVMFEPKWEEKKISFSLDIDEIKFEGNEDLLSQVWLNLLDNAIKFTPNGGSISISLKNTNRQLRFSIRDSGCGVDKQTANRIFDKFYQADSSRASAGNGLGLTLVKKIVELHHGTIACSSEENDGAEFVVILPMS